MSAEKRGWPALVAVGAVALLAIVAWCLWVVLSVAALRRGVEHNVGTLGALGRLRAALERGGPELAAEADAVIALAAQSTRATGADGDALASAVRTGDVTAAGAAIDRLTAAVRARNRALSSQLGDRWRYLYVVAAIVIVLAAGLLVVLVVSHRRRLRAEASEATLAARDATLRDAARRWVDGELAVPVRPRGEALDDFEQALDDVRGALAARLEEVDERRREVARLNDELRLQVKQKSEQLAAALSRTPARAALAAGAIVAGRFEIVGMLGEGGMGSVYAVRRVADGQQLALKLLRDDGNEVHRARFVREARLLAEVDHPNVLRILDVDVTDGGSLYLITELVEGKNLADDDHARASDTGAILGGVAAGLAAIHARGVVHRDLKLANIVVGARPSGELVVKIVDFGIARDLAATPADVPVQEITTHGVMLGTLRYMAPECRQASPPGPAADVFGFGVVAFRLLHGRFPWPTPAIVMIKALGHLPEPRFGPADPPVTPQTALVLRCLDEDPAARPSSADLAAAFTP